MSDDVPREQVQTALEFLKWIHGDVLRRSVEVWVIEERESMWGEP